MPKAKFNWDHAAGIVWPILVNRARDRKLIYYGEIAPHIDVHHRHVRLALGPIQSYCMEYELPPLTAIVISKTKSAPGAGFVAWDHNRAEEAQKHVLDFDWNSAPNPFALFSDIDTEQSIVETLLESPKTAAQTFAKVPVRGMAQRVFRSALMRAYNFQCAMCGLSFTDALEGAHIIPFGRCAPEHKISPVNGILLCSSHHKLFDAAVMTINSKYEVVYEDPDGANVPYSEADTRFTFNIMGKRIALPKDSNLWPSVDLLRQRNEEHEWTPALLREQ